MSAAQEIDVDWKKEAVDVILFPNLLRWGLERREQKGVMGRGGGGGKSLTALMKAFQNVSNLVSGFKSFPEMNSGVHGALVRGSQLW